MTPGFIILLLLVNCLAHLMQSFQLLKTFQKEITPVLVFGLLNLVLALVVLFQVPYALYASLIVILVGGIGGGNQVMKLDTGGCLNRAIVLINIVLVLSLLWFIFVV